MSEEDKKEKQKEIKKEVTFISDKKDTDAFAIWLDIDKIMIGGAVGNAIKELQENQKAIAHILRLCFPVLNLKEHLNGPKILKELSDIVDGKSVKEN